MFKYLVFLCLSLVISAAAIAKSEYETIHCKTDEVEIKIRTHTHHAYFDELKFIDGDFVEIRYKEQTFRFEHILTSTDGAGNFRFQAYELNSFHGAKEVLNLFNDHEGATIEGFFMIPEPGPVPTYIDLNNYLTIEVPYTTEACQWK